MTQKIFDFDKKKKECNIDRITCVTCTFLFVVAIIANAELANSIMQCD